MAASWVLKVPRSDDDQGHVLIQVSRKDGRPDLDLTLLGTESSLAYSTKCTLMGFVGDASDFSMLIHSPQHLCEARLINLQ